MKKTYVLFNLDDQGYAIDIDLVVEVTEISETTEVPFSDNNKQGVLNLRGDIISIIDLKTILGLEKSNLENKQVIIVKKDGKRVGFLVDNARDIRSYKKDSIKDAISFNSKNINYIESIINAEGEIIIVINVKNIIS